MRNLRENWVCECSLVCVCVCVCMDFVYGFWLSVLLVKLVWVIYVYNEVFVVAFVKCILFFVFLLDLGLNGYMNLSTTPSLSICITLYGLCTPHFTTELTINYNLLQYLPIFMCKVFRFCCFLDLFCLLFFFAETITFTIPLQR